jgi:hypothetical protein
MGNGGQSPTYQFSTLFGGIHGAFNHLGEDYGLNKAYLDSSGLNKALYALEEKTYVFN